MSLIVTHLISLKFLKLAAVSVSVSSMNKYEKMLSVWHAGKMFYTLATWGIALAG